MEKYECQKCNKEINYSEVDTPVLTNKTVYEAPNSDGVHTVVDGFIHKKCGGGVIKKEYV